MWAKERGQGELATPFFTISIIRAALGWTEYGVWGWVSLTIGGAGRPAKSSLSPTAAEAVSVHMSESLS